MLKMKKKMKSKTVGFDIGEINNYVINDLSEANYQMEVMLEVAYQIAVAHIAHIEKSRDAGMWLVDPKMNKQCEWFVRSYREFKESQYRDKKSITY